MLEGIALFCNKIAIFVAMKPVNNKIEQPSQLLEYLFKIFADKSKTTVKSYLYNRQVSVNGCLTTQFDAQLAVGDTVEVSFGKQKESLRHPMMKIVYEDDFVVVVNKRSGLLSIATDKQPLRTAYSILSDYLKVDNPSARIFVVHRLDRETSGLMMFAKSKEVQEKLQFNWNDNILERKYYAVVEGVIEQSEGVVESYLTESKAFKVYATDHEHGKLARTAFKVLEVSSDNTLLELQLETGRKNQIRAHLEYVGYPIIGDKKYGAKTNPLGRVALHAGTLSFLHPDDGREMNFSTPVPSVFMTLFGGKLNNRRANGKYQKARR